MPILVHRATGPVVAWCCLCILSMQTACADSVIIAADYNQRIPAEGHGHAWMDPVSLEVTEHFSIHDLDVRLDITHGEVSDLQIILESPWRQTVQLKSEWLAPWRDPRANMSATIFDDEATTALIDAGAPYTGRFTCDDGYLLSAFDDHDAFGTWTLSIYDAIYGQFGSLDHWALHIEGTVSPEPLSLLYVLLGIIYSRRTLRPSRHRTSPHR